MIKLYKILKSVEAEAISRLPALSATSEVAAARQDKIARIKDQIKTLGFRCGYDLLDKAPEQLSEAERHWVVQQLADLILNPKVEESLQQRLIPQYQALLDNVSHDYIKSYDRWLASVMNAQSEARRPLSTSAATAVRAPSQQVLDLAMARLRRQTTSVLPSAPAMGPDLKVSSGGDDEPTAPSFLSSTPTMDGSLFAHQRGQSAFPRAIPVPLEPGAADYPGSAGLAGIVSHAAVSTEGVILESVNRADSNQLLLAQIKKIAAITQDNHLRVQIVILYMKFGGLLSNEEQRIFATAKQQSLQPGPSRPAAEWLNFWRVAEGAAVATHAGLALHAVPAVAATTSGLSAAIGAMSAGLFWFANQTRHRVTELLQQTPMLAPALKIASGVLYLIIMLPLILKTLSKDIRNIRSSKYQEKRSDSLARLGLSVVLMLVGVGIGVAAAVLNLGGGWAVALGLAGLGWIAGHYMYKRYKRNRDKAKYFGCTNPQKYHLTAAQLQSAVLDKLKARPLEAQAKITNNLVKLCTELEMKARVEKARRANQRNFLWGISYRLWGIDRKTAARRGAVDALYALKRARYGALADNAAVAGIAINEDYASAQAQSISTLPRLH